MLLHCAEKQKLYHNNLRCEAVKNYTARYLRVKYHIVFYIFFTNPLIIINIQLFNHRMII